MDMLILAIFEACELSRMNSEWAGERADTWLDDMTRGIDATAYAAADADMITQAELNEITGITSECRDMPSKAELRRLVQRAA